MNDEISFGDFRESQPLAGLPPAGNPLYCVGWVGPQPPSGMPVYVDLDTMRQLELHAQSNVAVELGGVLLGERRVDAEGQPFVVVHDSLAAEHYEATRGSFKFTHETWQAITRQRETYPPHLEMVGWYHTHPDWSVFLSSMDLFICEHFFNHPLDLALVIDPIRDDRGWFVWGGTDRKSIGRTPGYFLFAHRGRSQELALVVESYNEVQTMQTDPRYRTLQAPPLGASSAPIVHLQERSLLGPLLALGLLAATQILLLVWLVLRSGETTAAAAARVDRLEQRLTGMGAQQSSAAQAAAYRDLLVGLLEKKPEDAGLVDRWAAASESNRQLQLALAGHVALQEKLQTEQGIVTAKLAAAEQLSRQLDQKLTQQAAELEQLRAAAENTPSPADQPAGWPVWAYWGVGGGLLLAVAAGSYWAGRRGWPEHGWTDTASS